MGQNLVDIGSELTQEEIQEDLETLKRIESGEEEGIPHDEFWERMDKFADKLVK